jgi:hypothetical protein
VGTVKVRYYVTRKAWPGSRATWGYWSPTKKMKAMGFHFVDCGEDGPHAWAIAESWNARWDEACKAAEAAAATSNKVRTFPAGSLGEAFATFRATETWKAKKPRTQEDWWRGWGHIEPIFGDIPPGAVSMQELDRWYAWLLVAKGVREAHRAMKIWRALWRVAGTLNSSIGGRYCDRDGDPSLGIRRKTPKPRNAIWYEGEAVRLVKGAIRMKYAGLASALAIAWDTMLSPVDVRGLTMAGLKGDAHGSLFNVARAKTGRAAIGTLSKRAARLLTSYVASLPFELHPAMPIFHTRGAEPGPLGGRPRRPVPYTKDTFGDDFRVVRNALFPGDSRQLGDFRRSGAVEATAGEVDPAALAGKMANSIDQNKELQATYQPHNATLVRLADEARKRGRGRLRRDKS